MKQSWKIIKHLEEVNATHLKRGSKIAEYSENKILCHAAEAIVELAGATDDIEELADTMSCLIHYAVRKGWSRNDLDNTLMTKLVLRFGDQCKE